ncbi:capsular polysaccharide synthesis protein [Lactiplantibacillus plantarum]|uniref:capsular polysaccharide synthesis protein n=1 Tax=Lactiplantibacillus plantarum TaxID=1590 RepID=UPI003F744D06
MTGDQIDNYNLKYYTNFPKYILEKRRSGKISDAHFSDLLRVELLTRYGGMWIDATVFCSTDKMPDYYTDGDLFVFKQLELNRNKIQPIVASSWLISTSTSNNHILMLTKKLLWRYWRDFNYLNNYFLFHICFTVATEKYNVEWEDVPVENNVTPHQLQFEFQKNYSEKRWKQLTQASVFHKLNHHVDYNQNSDSFLIILSESIMEIDDETNISRTYSI